VVRQRPAVDVTTVNSPSVRQGEVGLYTEKWGTLTGYRVVDGQHRGVRMVVVRHSRVVSNRSRFPASLRVRDVVLVGRGSGAGELAHLRAGQRLTPDVSLSEDVAMAITGNMFILRDGKRVATDDVDLHPRTAIGIDHDTGQLLLLVIDGRQSFSRGATMKELGKLFQRLGAEDALNLDGGGSTATVVGTTLLTRPSDATGERPVGDAIVVLGEG
jgi:hypothetical protein